MTIRKSPDFVVRQQCPFNGGPPLAALTATHETPVESFFVRNHGEVPAIDPGEYRLEIEGLVGKPGSWSLEQLRALPPRQVQATLQCAGNRRLELMAHKEIHGELPWDAEAIGNARWEGAALADLLAELEVDPAARFLHAEGWDETERHGHRFFFGGSIPLDKALAAEVLLAWGMNGAPLEPTHGAPLRLVVPGYIGARSVKWLKVLRLSEVPSPNYFQSTAYRLFPADASKDNVVWADGMPLGEVALTSIVTSPLDGAALSSGPIPVQGVALAGGRSIARVEVSADGGQTWQQAELGNDHGRWVWRQWRATLQLPAGDYELVARAWDTTGQTQPEAVAHVWNFKGYVNTAWHRIKVACR